MNQPAMPRRLLRVAARLGIVTQGEARSRSGQAPMARGVAWPRVDEYLRLSSKWRKALAAAPPGLGNDFAIVTHGLRHGLLTDAATFSTKCRADATARRLERYLGGRGQCGTTLRRRIWEGEAQWQGEAPAEPQQSFQFSGVQF